MKKQFLILFAFISVLAFSQVPQRFNKVIVTGDITSPKFIKTGSTADSVLLGNGSARAISTFKTDTVSLSNRINAKATGNGTANGTNTGDETLTSIKTKLGAATSVSDGYLKYQDFVKFDSKEPAITKNTAFNKNFGTTPGTVLEGRTFGTAANSAVGDFQPTITGLTANNFPIWNGATFINSPLVSGINGISLSSSTIPNMVFTGQGAVDPAIYFGRYSGAGLDNAAKIQYEYRAASSQESGSLSFWTNPNAAGAGSLTKRMTVGYDGVVNIHSTTASTSPATGALVVNGGIGANHVRANNFYGNGSNLTGVQLPITLTTNGTSGAATFSGNVLNVPNYDVSGVVNQSLITVNGSTSGSMVCSMPFQTGSYKKVIIYLTNLVGTAEYIFPVRFVGGASKRIITTNVTVGTSGSFPDDRVNITATSGNGTITIEGY